MKANGWFEVDKEGLAAINQKRDKTFALFELIQNAWDEKVRKVSVLLEPIEGRRGRARLRVEDDSPDGFRDLTHAYTLFAPSLKKFDAEKRGRYNFGEKLVLAFCEEATIQSTTGGVRFDSQGRTKIRSRREAGTVFEAIIRLTREECQEVSHQVFTLIPPSGVRTYFNGQEIPQRTPVHEFEATLATEYASENGQLRSTHRKTKVRLYEALVGSEAPSIYELGIPVVEVECGWHIDVQQKVPLNMDRDNVKPSYLKVLNTRVFNEMAAKMQDQEMASGWVTEAISNEHVTDGAVRAAIAGRFGKKAVIYDPSDPEANKLATAAGYTVIPGRALPKEAWDSVRRAKAVLPAGQVTPSPKPPDSGPGGMPPIPEEQWTPGMRQVVAYARDFARLVLDRHIYVQIHRCPDTKAIAWYGSGSLTFNLSRLGNRWFDQAQEQKVDELLIHELGHEYASDHLSDEYYDALCRIGARLKAVAGQLRLDPQVAAAPARGVP